MTDMLTCWNGNEVDGDQLLNSNNNIWKVARGQAIVGIVFEGS